MRELILGGARSGKSTLAEQRAAASDRDVTYVATATAGDTEMAERIAHHRQRRPGHWRTVEAGGELAATLAREAAPERCLLVDCLTLWLGQLIADESVLARERTALLDGLAALPGDILLVSNEVGLGIVPADALARQFRDEAGRLNQAVAAQCERVTFVAAGLPLTLKQP
jgi:adenosylcobinamide kinase/adenosylcobinamide-phosphate guanylyltransferase